MTKFLIALVAVLTIGAGVANAATQQSKAPQQQGDAFNFLEGGGG